MTEPTSLSTPQSQNVQDAPSNENSQQQKNEDSWLSEIPLLPTKSQNTKTEPELKTDLSFMEPSSCENQNPSSSDLPVEEVVEGKFEYEFTNLWDGCLYSVYLYDTNDRSACERVVNRPVEVSEIIYSDSGNGFITDGEFKYTFCKNPMKRIYSPPTSVEANIRRRTSIRVRTAEDIISSL